MATENVKSNIEYRREGELLWLRLKTKWFKYRLRVLLVGSLFLGLRWALSWVYIYSVGQWIFFGQAK